jgi:S1-C subfamily serine protease
MGYRVKPLTCALVISLAVLGSGRTALAQQGDSWVRLFEAANGEYSSYLDTDSFEQVGEEDWAVWVRMNYSKDRSDGFLSPSYRSDQRRYVVKCKARQVATTQRTLYSQDGSPVKQDSWPESKWEYRAIGPSGGSNFAEFERICGLAALPLRRLDWSRRGDWRQIGPAISLDISAIRSVDRFIFYRTRIEHSDGMRVRDKRRVASVAYFVADCESKTTGVYASASLGESSDVLDSTVIPLNSLQSSNVVPDSPNAAVLQAVCPGAIEAKDTDKAATTGTSTGTAVAISSAGHWLTNAHVVSRCKAISVTPSNRTNVAASIIAFDARNDLALLKSEPVAGQTAGFRDRTVVVGESVYAFGFPLAGALASGGVFTSGIVNATAGLGDDTRLLQISAPIQPGNSGGPLLDSSGLLAGIVVSKLNAIEVFKITGQIPENVNFAIKSSVAQSFLETYGVNISKQAPRPPVAPPALAETARAIAGFVRCDR